MCANNENRQSEGYGPNLGAALLPTPTTQPTTGNGHARDLGTEVRMLPTPTAERYGSNQSPSEGATVRYGLDSIDKLLPTPTTQDTDEACSSQLDRNTIPLNTLVTLLPTPSVADVEGGRKCRSGERGDELLLNGLAAANRFGDYAPAIERWERLLRPAPDPTEPNDRGGRRLSARFVEWMQGMPDGHVTSIGLTRVQQLRILGNIVVPQQAAHALRLMRDEEREVEGVAA